jgi:type III restriction enzyme
VEWQKSLSRIAATKGRRFVQVDFSATPYNDVGSGKNKKKLYFPHIVTDFDLKSAMRAGLVKSLVLDRRKEIGALPLEFKAERDEAGNPYAERRPARDAAGGLSKLRKLEADFARIDPTAPPQDAGGVRGHHGVAAGRAVSARAGRLAATDEVMTIDSGKEGRAGREGLGAGARAAVQRGQPCHAARDRQRADAARGL